MSILTPLRAARRRHPRAPAIGPVSLQEWHVGLARKGDFPVEEVNCPCAMAPCGLAIPRPEVFCARHQGAVEYAQMHVAAECGGQLPRPRRWFERNDRIGR